MIGSCVDRGKIGQSDNRPNFQRMIYNSNQHQFDVVLVWRYDRFARNMEDHAVYEHMLRKNQVSVISATEPIPEVFHAPIVKGVILGYNESYSAELAAKVTDGMYKAALKGQSFGGGRVLGYRTVDKAWVVDEGEAQIVRMIFDLYHSGKSISEIVLILNEKISRIHAAAHSRSAACAAFSAIKNILASFPGRERTSVQGFPHYRQGTF